MGKLVPGDGKDTVTQITTGYYQVMQTSISERGRKGAAATEDHTGAPPVSQ